MTKKPKQAQQLTIDYLKDIEYLSKKIGQDSYILFIQKMLIALY